MKFTKVITAYGVDFDVEFAGYEGWRGSRDEPPEPPEVDDMIVSLGGQEITELLTQGTLDLIEEKAYEIVRNARREAEAEAAECRWEDMKDERMLENA